MVRAIQVSLCAGLFMFVTFLVGHITGVKNVTNYNLEKEDIELVACVARGTVDRRYCEAYYKIREIELKGDLLVRTKLSYYLFR